MASSCSSSSTTATCPVDHTSQRESCPVGHNSAKNASVDRGSQSYWDRLLSSADASHSPASAFHRTAKYPQYPRRATETGCTPPKHSSLPPWRARTIIRTVDMKTIVPIHNAVNKRAWGEIMMGVKLVNFKGRPGDRSPKAELNMLLGYLSFFPAFSISYQLFRSDRFSAPLDRHDCVVERCGSRVRHIIDFYIDRSTSKNDMSFNLDVRPRCCWRRRGKEASTSCSV
jgi:cytochrome c heme-lyase